MTHYTPLFDSICTSGRMADLPDDTCRLFYVLVLARCDAWGRLDARPRKLNASVWPLLGKSDDETGRVLEALRAAGLVDLYWPTGSDPFLQIPDWEEKAGRVGRRSHRTASRHPSPEDVADCKLPGGSGICGHSRADRAKPGDTVVGDGDGAVARDGVQGKGSTKPSAPKAAKSKDPAPARQVTDHWCAAYASRRGAKYAFQGAKDGKAVAAVLKAAEGDVAEVCRYIDRAFADEWWGDKLDLTLFAANWNRFAPTPAEVEAKRKEAPKRESVERAIAARRKVLESMDPATLEGRKVIQAHRKESQTDAEVIESLRLEIEKASAAL